LDLTKKTPGNTLVQFNCKLVFNETNKQQRNLKDLTKREEKNSLSKFCWLSSSAL